MAVQRLVSNGCSYMAEYAIGGGHHDLAKSLNIEQCESLAKHGTSNHRLLRTTIRDSLCADVSTLYVLGITFISRTEYPIDVPKNNLDGPWLSVQNSIPRLPAHPEQILTERDMQDLYRIKEKICMLGSYWYFDDFCLRLISLIDNLKNRGHQCLVFMTADVQHLEYLDDDRFQMLGRYPEIVDGLKWLAIPWQHSAGVPDQYDEHVPAEMRHRERGQHAMLNSFFLEYMRQHPEIYPINV